MRLRGAILISEEALKEKLGLDESTDIIGVKFLPNRNTIELQLKFDGPLRVGDALCPSRNTVEGEESARLMSLESHGWIDGAGVERGFKQVAPHVYIRPEKA